jgi:hypothetical protein
MTEWKETRPYWECWGSSLKARLILGGRPILSPGWPLKFGTVAEAIPNGVPYGKFVHDTFDTSTTWKDIEWVRSIFPGEIILKGILDPDDAQRAVRTNIQASGLS